MATAKKATNAKQEKEVRNEQDYSNSVKDYESKKDAVDSAFVMIDTDFWEKGFKSRRELVDKTHKALMESLSEKSGEDYDSIEYVKLLNKTKLAHSKAVKDFDNYVADVQNSVDVLHIFCGDENLQLFDDLKMKEATFSRKTGKLTWKQVK